jgi:uncharacterized protein
MQAWHTILEIFIRFIYQEVKVSPFFWKKSKSIEKMIEEYMDALEACMHTFKKSIKYYMKNGHNDEFDKLKRLTHKHESLADDIRREIEMKLYGKALLPESRGDVLGMLESLDKIASVAEDAVALLCIEQPKIPDFIISYFPKLVELNMEAFILICKGVDAIASNPREVLYIDKEIDMKESESDTLEDKMLRKIFSSDIELAEKQQLRRLIGTIGSVSDCCQNSIDRIGLIAIKRRI